MNKRGGASSAGLGEFVRLGLILASAILVILWVYTSFYGKLNASSTSPEERALNNLANVINNARGEMDFRVPIFIDKEICYGSGNCSNNCCDQISQAQYFY